MFPRRRPLLITAGTLALLFLTVGYICLTGAAGVVATSLIAVGVTISYATSISGGGVSIQTQPVLRTGSGAIGYQETLVAGTAGTLSTRTSDTAGTLTVATGHSIVTGDTIDVHWDIGGVKGVAYGCTVGTVAAAPGDTSIPFTGASGDVLPAQDSSVVASEQLSVNTNIDGDNAKILSLVVETNDKSLRTGAHVQFQDSGSAEIAEIDLVTNVPKVWDIEGGSNNPFTGNPITTAKISNGGSVSTETYTFKAVGVADASP